MPGYNPKDKVKLFRRVLGGDGAALGELMESERAELYDYLLRMTGQVNRSLETIDEVYASLNEDVLSDLTDYGDWRLCVFTTARKFNADIWYADTAKLMNAALDAAPNGTWRDALMRADRWLRMVPGPAREVAVLHALHKLDLTEIAEIMTTSVESAAAEWQEVERQAAALLTDSNLLGRVPLHPVPARSSHATVNLSVIMAGIKAKPVGIWSPVRLGVPCACMLLVIYFALHPDLVHRFMVHLRAAIRAAGG